jgi:hypothetical protein
MPEPIAQQLLDLASLYLLAGLLFAAVFLSIGIGRIDPNAKGTSLGFRLVVLPGVVVLWPLLAWRWLRGVRHPPDECSPHIRASRRGP